MWLLNPWSMSCTTSNWRSGKHSLIGIVWNCHGINTLTMTNFNFLWLSTMTMKEITEMTMRVVGKRNIIHSCKLTLNNSAILLHQLLILPSLKCAYLTPLFLGSVSFDFPRWVLPCKMNLPAFLWDLLGFSLSSQETFINLEMTHLISFQILTGHKEGGKERIN
jgi:hypothetical protein